MKKLVKIAFMAVAFSILGLGADSALAQGKNKAYKQDRREARREYRQEVRQARREYRQDIREARRENGVTRNSRIYNTRPYGRAYGYRNVRPYVGNRRTASSDRYRYIYRNGRRYLVRY